MKYLFFIVISVFLCACGASTSSNDLPKDENGRENFGSFHQKFFSDSVFQFRRIEFPMLGTSPSGAEERFFWTEENWKLIKEISEEEEGIERHVYDMDNVMQEKILVENRFMIKLMYSLIDQKWFLTEYSGIKDLSFFAKPQEENPTPKNEPVLEFNDSISD